MWKGLFALTLVSFLYISSSFAALGKCKKIEAMENVTARNLYFRWYEYAKTKGISDVLTRCSYYELSLQKENLFNVVYVYFILNKLFIDTWLISIQNSDMPYSREARRPTVLSTDYRTYAIFRNCQEGPLHLTNSDNIYVLTRYRMPPQKTIDKINQVLQEKKIDKNSLSKVDQKNCPKIIINRDR